MRSSSINLNVFYINIGDEEIKVDLIPVNSASAAFTEENLNPPAATVTGGVGEGSNALAMVGMSAIFKKDALKRVDSFEEEVLQCKSSLFLHLKIWLSYY